MPSKLLFEGNTEVPAMLSKLLFEDNVRPSVLAENE